MESPTTPRTEMLRGFTIGITADRRATDQATLFERRGAVVVHGPTLSSKYARDDKGLHDVTVRLIADPPDFVVANTGVGMRAWIEAAIAWDLGDSLIGALMSTCVVARGAKAAGAAAAVGVQPEFRADGETLEEVGAWITQRVLEKANQHADDPPCPVQIVLQLDGREAHQGFMQSLSAINEHCIVTEIPVYRTARTTDPSAAHQLITAITERRVDAVTFTSAPAVTALLELAQDTNQRDALLDALEHDVIVSCVGDVCAAQARALGMNQAIAPAVGRLGLMAKQLSEQLDQRVQRVVIDNVSLEQRGNLLTMNDATPEPFEVLDTNDSDALEFETAPNDLLLDKPDKSDVPNFEVALTPAERCIVRLLLDQPHTPVSDEAISSAWPGPIPSPPAIASTIARLRKQLAPTPIMLTHTARRGHRLARRVS